MRGTVAATRRYQSSIHKDVLVNVGTASMTTKLELVARKAALLLPGDAGQRLLALITPAALATMATVTGLWAAAHFFGAGEVADVILLFVGIAALGGSALEAGKHLVAFALKTSDARTEHDLDEAARHLAIAVSIMGIDFTIALLLHRKPKGIFSNSHGGEMPKFSEAFPRPLPRNGRFAYKPTTKFTRELFAGQGGTDPLGNVRIGRKFYPEAKPVGEAIKQMRLTATHERVHQLLKPKLYLLRKVRMYAMRSAYKRSYILRYLEEAFAEGMSRAKWNGITKEEFLSTRSFPLGDNYQITLVDLAQEGRGILMGPITVGGAVFYVYYEKVH